VLSFAAQRTLYRKICEVFVADVTSFLADAIPPRQVLVALLFVLAEHLILTSLDARPLSLVCHLRQSTGYRVVPHRSREISCQ
jgi:hypothetical protein